MELEPRDLLGKDKRLRLGRIADKVELSEVQPVPSPAEGQEAATNAIAKLGACGHVGKVLLQGAQQDKDGSLEDIEVGGEEKVVDNLVFVLADADQTLQDTIELTS